MTTEDVPQFEQRALVLAPLGRDAAVAGKVLREAGIGAESCPDLGAMVREVVRGAATALIAEEEVLTADLTALAA